MNDPQMIDEYLGASGSTRVSRKDLELLGRYASKNGAAYCQHGCSLCEGACPAGVEISEVLRNRMYAVDYRDSALAREDYAKLPRGASACLSCDRSPCAGACPNGINIAARTREAVRSLA
jgi:predicted aldo/keto reductase-like oxidoreductase